MSNNTSRPTSAGAWRRPKTSGSGFGSSSSASRNPFGINLPNDNVINNSRNLQINHENTKSYKRPTPTNTTTATVNNNGNINGPTLVSNNMVNDQWNTSYRLYYGYTDGINTTTTTTINTNTANNSGNNSNNRMKKTSSKSDVLEGKVMTATSYNSSGTSYPNITTASNNNNNNKSITTSSTNNVNKLFQVPPSYIPPPVLSYQQMQQQQTSFFHTTTSSPYYTPPPNTTNKNDNKTTNNNMSINTTDKGNGSINDYSLNKSASAPVIGTTTTTTTINTNPNTVTNTNNNMTKTTVDRMRDAIAASRQRIEAEDAANTTMGIQNSTSHMKTTSETPQRTELKKGANNNKGNTDESVMKNTQQYMSNSAANSAKTVISDVTTTAAAVTVQSNDNYTMPHISNTARSYDSHNHIQKSTINTTNINSSTTIIPNSSRSGDMMTHSNTPLPQLTSPKTNLTSDVTGTNHTQSVQSLLTATTNHTTNTANNHNIGPTNSTSSTTATPTKVQPLQEVITPLKIQSGQEFNSKSEVFTIQSTHTGALISTAISTDKPHHHHTTTTTTMTDTDNSINNLNNNDDDEMDGKRIMTSIDGSVTRSHPEVTTTPSLTSLENPYIITMDIRANSSLDSLTEESMDIGISTVPNQFCSIPDALDLKRMLLLTNGVRGGMMPTSTSVMDMYMVGKVIGVGSYGKVRAAWHRLTGTKVAIKTYDKSKMKDESHWKRVYSEIKIMEMASHPRIARMYEAIETPKRMHLIIECLDGGNLCTYVKDKKRLNEDEAKLIFYQLVQSIDYLHSLDIAHRDIKLENILFTSSNNEINKDIKLIDFGFSTICQPGKKLKVFCGTPSYMAPEIVRRTEYEGKPVDIWSLGILLYALLFGCFPFRAKSYPDLYRRIARGTFSIPDDVSNTVKDLLIQLLEVDVNRRITSTYILKHPWLQSCPLIHLDMKKMKSDISFLISDKPSEDIDDEVLFELDKFGLPRQDIVKLILAKLHSSMTTLYYLLLDIYVKRRKRNPSSSAHHHHHSHHHHHTATTTTSNSSNNNNIVTSTNNTTTTTTTTGTHSHTHTKSGTNVSKGNAVVTSASSSASSSSSKSNTPQPYIPSTTTNKTPIHLYPNNTETTTSRPAETIRSLSTGNIRTSLNAINSTNNTSRNTGNTTSNTTSTNVNMNANKATTATNDNTNTNTNGRIDFYNYYYNANNNNNNTNNNTTSSSSNKPVTSSSSSSIGGMNNNNNTSRPKTSSNTSTNVTSIKTNIDYVSNIPTTTTTTTNTNVNSNNSNNSINYNGYAYLNQKYVYTPNMNNANTASTTPQRPKSAYVGRR